MSAKFAVSAAERQARAAAFGKGLFVLFEGRGEGRVWAVYGRESGRKVATYYPASGRCLRHGGGADFVEPDGIKMLNAVREGQG